MLEMAGVASKLGWLAGFEAAPDVSSQRLYRIFRFFYRRHIGLSTLHRREKNRMYSRETTLLVHFEFLEAIPKRILGTMSSTTL